MLKHISILNAYAVLIVCKLNLQLFVLSINEVNWLTLPLTKIGCQYLRIASVIKFSSTLTLFSETHRCLLNVYLYLEIIQVGEQIASSMFVCGGI